MNEASDSACCAPSCALLTQITTFSLTFYLSDVGRMKRFASEDAEGSPTKMRRTDHGTNSDAVQLQTSHLMAISGLDEENAGALLTTTNFDLDLAIDLYLSGVWMPLKSGTDDGGSIRMFEAEERLPVEPQKSNTATYIGIAIKIVTGEEFSTISRRFDPKDKIASLYDFVLSSSLEIAQKGGAAFDLRVDKCSGWTDGYLPNPFDGGFNHHDAHNWTLGMYGIPYRIYR